ncbi:hypothetical protein EC991_001786 [Linnemannia zychae]|nr:hypothetical protein EC991_001786 [Linnemannia zychae]
MLGLISNSTGFISFDAMKDAIPMSIDLSSAIIPFGIGLASMAFMAMSTVGERFSTDKSIPIVSLRHGESTHDKEYLEDQDAFLERCQSQYGEVFNVYLMNKCMTVVSGPMIRDIFMTEDFSFMDALDDMTGARAFFLSMTKSHHEIDSPEIHEIVRDMITPNLSKFSARIVNQLEKNLDEEMAKLLSPLQKHVKVLLNASTPVVLERRRLEQEAKAEGRIYERPDDILQRLLDDSEKYEMVDLEDICGHLIMLVLSGVHTTADASANMIYYLAAFPECIDKLFEEQQEVLDGIQKEREQQRQVLIAKGESIPEDLNPSKDRALSAAAIKRMTHMDSFVREVFRYRTEQLSLAHRARRDVTLSNGMVISKGVTAIINMKSVHQSADQGEDVKKFLPWRFVGKPKTATRIGSDYMPFGMGKHACPGRFLAIQELKTIGLLMISRYSKIEIQDPSKTQRILRIRTGASYGTGLLLTRRQ